MDNNTIAPNTKLATRIVPLDPESYNNYGPNEYSPDLMFDAMTGFIAEDKDQPIFFYWATPIPHAALQAPKRLVDY